MNQTFRLPKPQRGQTVHLKASPGFSKGQMLVPYTPAVLNPQLSGLDFLNFFYGKKAFRSSRSSFGFGMARQFKPRRLGDERRVRLNDPRVLLGFHG